MNYYNPYLYTFPTVTNIKKVGLLSRLFGGRSITFTSILNGTQKTLNIVNQTIPLVKQVHPMVKNAKTMFKVMNEFKKSGYKPNPTQTNTINNISNDSNQVEYQNGPTYFL